MAMFFHFTAVIMREGDAYVALCPELNVASQGASVAEARANLIEAVELFLETASEEEIQERLHDEVYVTRIAVSSIQRIALRKLTQLGQEMGFYD